jgi:hypothetical protein
MSIAAFAQEAGQVRVYKSESADAEKIRVETINTAGGFVTAGPFDVQFMGMEYSFAGKAMKGAPYSGEEVTETTQLLADGNRIYRKSTAQVYRDKEGRTRTDRTMNALGPYATSGEPQRNIVINDSVAGVNYILDPQARIARKLATVVAESNSNPDPNLAERRAKERMAKVIAEQKLAGAVGSATAPKAEAHEDLGTQNIGGVLAQGTRTTVTLPAGQIGNDLPIKIVSERWVSSDLGVVVMTTRSDPRFGETVYHLNNISRADPDPSLFQVPADYTVQEMNRNAAEKMVLRGK